MDESSESASSSGASPSGAAPSDTATRDPRPGRRGSRARRLGVAAGAAVLVAMGVAAALVLVDAAPISPQVRAVEVTRTGPAGWDTPDPAPRTVEVYAGQGAWVDVFDFAPAQAGPNPPVGPGATAEMAAHDVTTLYLQASRYAADDPEPLEDPWLLAEWLLRAHQEGIAVVGWYLPLWSEDDTDLEHMQAIADFSVLGHRFDGVAVDIEWNQGGLDVDERNRRLIELSAGLRAHVGEDEALGAIVVPAVLTEVVNPQFWPRFPYAELAPLYDVWLPMAYWSFRSEDSGYRDGYRYTEESIRRLRANLGRPDAPVHAVGGIGAVNDPDGRVVDGEPLASIDQLEGFVRSLVDTGAIGGSLYDWRVTDAVSRARLQELFDEVINEPSA